MNLVKRSFAILKPVIWTSWIVAAIRLAIEARTTDMNVVAMFSVYATIVVLFLFAAFSGALDALAWKPLFVGALLLGVLCFGIPNTISYAVAQFEGWSHGRFYSDPDATKLLRKYQDAGDGFWKAREKAQAELGHEDMTRGPPIGRTTGEKLTAALTVGGATSIAGTLWSLVLGILLIGIPASMRRRRST